MSKVAILTEKQMQEMADEVAQLRAENERLRLIERAARELVEETEHTFARDFPEVARLRQALAKVE